jgi:anthranilate synthase component 1
MVVKTVINNVSVQPEFPAFETNFKAGQTQLVWRWIPADMTTPVSAYLKLCGHEPYGFLLESVEGGAALGRYSVIGLKPDLIWNYQGGEISIARGGSAPEIQDNAPLDSLRAMLSEARIDTAPDDLPPMAVSGLFGYMGYDMVRVVEDIPDTNPDDLNMPDSVMIRPSILCIFDNIKNMMCLVTPVYNHADNCSDDAPSVYKRAISRLDQAYGTLQSPIDQTLIGTPTSLDAATGATSNMTREEYHGVVKRAVDYIEAGDVFQVVAGQRFSMDFDLPAFELYRSLRRLNPSPFMFHLAFDGFAITGSSPEILVRLRDNTVTMRPIAGTRKRGANAAEDQALIDDLLGDPKECAEHLMLLDLGRNDVGRVAQIGSVTVTEQFKVELYSHVMHIVSNVEGKLREDMDTLDALFAGFPAGTVSGAPKVRAMEIIDELEVSKRGYYAGGVGYLSGNGAHDKGTMDTCIALRTALVKDGKVHVQAGAGLVADSDPESEYQECINKAQAVIRAAQNALELARDSSNQD